MKRKLCIICLAAVAALAAAMPLWRNSSPPPFEDGQRVIAEGKIYWKETKQDRWVLYLQDTAIKPQANPNESSQGKSNNDQSGQGKSNQKQASPNKSNQNQSSQQQEERLSAGKIFCEMQEDAPYTIGSTVRIEGEFFAFARPSNPGEFDAKTYYESIGISASMRKGRLLSQKTRHGRLREMLFCLRQKCAKIYDACMEKEDAALMKAMLLGQKSDMDAQMKRLYRQAGIAHVLAISGLHISLIGMGAYRLLRKSGMPLPAAACAAMAFLAAYAAMIGGSPSSLRAVCMLSLYLFANIAGRSYDMLTSVSVSAFLLLLTQPSYLFYTGFLFSYGAVLGIACLTPVLRDIGSVCFFGVMRRIAAKCMGGHIRKREQRSLRMRAALAAWKAAGRLGNAFAAGLGVFLATLPVQLFSYYGISAYAVLLNLLIIPCMGVLVCAGGAGLLLGACSLPVGAACLKICHYVLLFYEKSAGASLLLPGSLWITGHPETWQAVIYYLLLLTGTVIASGLLFQRKESQGSGGACHAKTEKGKKAAQYAAKAAGTACMAAAFFLLTAHFETPGMWMTLLDVGQGDAAVIHSETGHTYLVDAGSSSRAKMAEYQLIPYLKYQGIDRIDCAVISHLDEDHYNGILQLLTLGKQEGIRVGRIVLSAAEIRDEAYRQLCSAAKAAGVPVMYMRSGDTIEDGKLLLQCLYPKNDINVTERNDCSIVLSVRYGAFFGILTGDLGENAEMEAARQAARAKGDAPLYTMLKAAHHGSRYSGSREFLTCVQPDVTVISCGKRNRYGHPHAETLERLKDAQSKIYITYETGAVTFVVNDKTVFEKTYKH